MTPYERKTAVNFVNSIFGSLLSDLPTFLLSLPAILLALSAHEAAHGYVAYRLGDPTARNLGRLTLNPLKHLDPIGALAMVLFHFGWAKPVPVNARYFKKPRRDMALTALAGPAANLLLGFIGVLLTRLYLLIGSLTGLFTGSGRDFGVTFAALFYVFLSVFAQLNVSLAVFNLIPVPPLDGSRILLIFLPPKAYFGLMRYERYIQIILIAALWLGLLSTPLSYLVSRILYGMDFLLSFIRF